MSAKPLLGSHVSFKSPDYLLGAIKEAASYGATALMIYLGAPQTTLRVSGVDYRLAEARALAEQAGIDYSSIIVHAPYIVNLATPDEEKAAFGLEFMTAELERARACGFQTMVFHPGAAVGQNPAEAVRKLADRLRMLLDRFPDLILALETMAGKGTELGGRLEELAELVSLIDRPNVGLTLDTCHLNDAGYDMSDFGAFLDGYEKIMPPGLIRCVHVNDSLNPRGSHKDRHANIGQGTIGLDALRRVVHERRLQAVPKILETPYIEGMPPYAAEIKALS